MFDLFLPLNRPWNTAHHRPQVAVQAQTYLGHPAAAQSERSHARPRDVQWRDRLQAPGGSLRTRAIVIQQKTGQPVPFEITEPMRGALAAWRKVRGRRQDDWLFPSRSRPGDHVSTRHYARLVDKWVSTTELEPRGYGTDSLRRTKVDLICKETGNLRACHLLLGHRKFESTVRYLGIEVDGLAICTRLGRRRERVEQGVRLTIAIVKQR